jgi:hypothetical protein
MTDADLIYNALLRAERRLEDELIVPGPDSKYEITAGALVAIGHFREELGNGLARERR